MLFQYAKIWQFYVDILTNYFCFNRKVQFFSLIKESDPEPLQKAAPALASNQNKCRSGCALVPVHKTIFFCLENLPVTI